MAANIGRAKPTPYHLSSGRNRVFQSQNLTRLNCIIADRACNSVVEPAYPCPKSHDKVGTAPLRLLRSDLSDTASHAETEPTPFCDRTAPECLELLQISTITTRVSA